MIGMEKELMKERCRNGFDWSRLHIGDLIRIGYQHHHSWKYEPTIGDFCYAIGYVVKITSSHLKLSNVDPDYCGQPSMHSRLKKSVSYRTDDIDGIVRIRLGRASEKAVESLEEKACSFTG